MIITPEDAFSVELVGKTGYCGAGMRAFALRYGLDWDKFMNGGISEEELLATGDWLAKKVVEHARKRREVG